MQKRLWITGYRAFELNIFSEKDPKIQVIKRALRDKIIEKIENEQSEDSFWVISGGQMGVEQFAAEIVYDLKKDFPQLKNAIMLPFTDFSSRWNQQHQEALEFLIQRADFSDHVFNKKYSSPLQLRQYQRFMFEHTDQALLIYDPQFPGKSQYDYSFIQEQQKKREDYRLDLVDFDYLTDLAQEMEEEKRPW
ncbi:DUF1273 domain-containing protein [Oenococcus alcoholitolerans]|uniref:UPF0398 protein Q757_04655 n=1 Tax=Oenococcus alcoholitolerans TaxID=931074 RepID=A0ABR4XR41_9LACO|nr:hypothetical protein Q757_04655 [Oenococcus alcoholitolerans]